MSTTMNPFTQMATVLAKKSHIKAAVKPEATQPKGTSRTERIRRLLRNAQWPMTAAEIAFDMEEDFPNFGSHLVWLLLKYDISKGRVELRNGLYSYNHGFDTDEQASVRDAEKLLKSHGYKVKAPTV